MTYSHDMSQPHDPLATRLSGADDRVRLSAWLPPQAGVVPKIRIGQHWINVLWALPLIFVLLVIGVAVAQALRELPAVQDFLVRYPGIPPSDVAVTTGFPDWLRLLHFLNLFFMAFIIRAGVQILADHPAAVLEARLHARDRMVPLPEGGSDRSDMDRQGRFGHPSRVAGYPRHPSLHRSRPLVALFDHAALDDQRHRLLRSLVHDRPVAETGADNVGRISNAASTALQYLSLTFPVDESWTRYNGLQQIAYFITVFIAAPTSIVTGLMQSPAISNRLGWFGRALNRQKARSIHFIALCWFLFFILAHVTLVFITDARANLNMMFAGVNDDSWSGLLVFIPAMLVVAVTWWLASPFTLRHARLVQRIGEFMSRPFGSVTQSWDPTSQLTENDISPHFWPNGTMPKSDEFDLLVKNNFADYRLRIGGLVETPMEFSYAELKAMPKQEQITTHFCIQGWSGVAKWGGVTMRHILDLVKPTVDARYAVFYSLADGSDGGRYYDVHSLSNMRHELTILAYEMNGAPVSVLHGAPLRLRCENEVGFKMVKWIAAIEFVHDYADLGAGQGGYNEDHEFFGYRVPI